MRRMLAGFAVLAAALSGCGYNEMVTMKESVDSAWAQVQNQLQRRNDLIPNLVEVTKGYAAHEKEIFESVANARSRLIAAGTRDEQIEAANQVSGALGRLLAIAEQYPQLKANEQFARLSDELAGTENRMSNMVLVCSSLRLVLLANPRAGTLLDRWIWAIASSAASWASRSATRWARRSSSAVRTTSPPRYRRSSSAGWARRRAPPPTTPRWR